MEPGIRGLESKTVTSAESAGKIGSGNLDVFGTPAVVAFVEETAWKSVADQLPKGQSTVGTKVEIFHTSATPIGCRVVCETELVEVDRRRLEFKFVVNDETEQVAHGTHQRFIIDRESFIEKANKNVPST